MQVRFVAEWWFAVVVGVAGSLGVAMAAQWCHELYETTLHPDDGRRLVELLSAGGRRDAAARVLEAVEQTERQRRWRVEIEAARQGR